MHWQFLRVTGMLVILGANQAYGFRADQYAIELSPASRSLSQQTVIDIFQDRNGFIWLLTQEGLNRYDGYEVVSFTSTRGDESSLSHQLTTDIAEDRQGRLWIATLGGGLNLFKEHSLTFEALRAGRAVSSDKPLSDFISSVAVGDSGALWIGYADGSGFSRFDPDKRQFAHYILPVQQSNTQVEGFAELDNGVLYVAVSGSGVYTLDRETEELALLDMTSSVSELDAPVTPSHILPLESGKLLITSSTEGAFLLDPSTNSIVRHPLHEISNADTANEIYTAMEDKVGNHWLGTRAGVAVYAENGEVTWLTEFNSNLPDAQILSIFQSQSGMVWLGTYSGLAQGTPSLFQTIDESMGLSSNGVNAIVSRGPGEWWIGTERGISILRAQKNAYGDWEVKSSQEPILQDYTIMSLATHEHLVWAGTLRSGMFEINTLSKEIVNYKNGSEGSLSFDGVSVIHPVDKEQLLVGTYGGGLNILNRETGLFSVFENNYQVSNSISDDRVICILEDSNGSIWVGTQSGLNLFDMETSSFTRFEYDASDPTTLSSNVILSLAEDLNRNLWVGTRSGGLNVWTSDLREAGTPTFVEFNLDGNIPSADIYGVKVDSLNSLWISHNAGLSRVDSLRRESINFDESTGLQGPEFNHGAAHASNDGTIFFGGPNGFNTINPQFDYSDKYEPPQQITSFKLLNEQLFFEKPYSQVRNVSLDYDYQFASISISSLDFRRPQSVNYRYRIDGIHNEWINLGKNRQISISGLSFGSYTLNLQGSNASGLWTAPSRTLGITISPPFWLTWYAYVAYGVLLASMAASVVQNQRRKAKAETERRLELEERVRERTADLQEARNEAEAAARAKSDFLATMSHEIRTPMHGMIGMTDLLLKSTLNAQQRMFAESAKDSGSALLEIIDSILDYSKIEAGKLELNESRFDVVSLIDNVCYLLSEKAREQKTNLLVVWSNSNHTQLIGDEGKVRQILTNLVGNAIKFTNDGRVTVRCKTVTTFTAADEAPACELEISVEDTGIGISQEKLSSIFEVFTQADASTTRQYGGTGLGLAISKQLADLMGGEINAVSEVGTGSKFSFRVKLSSADTTTNVVGTDIGTAGCVVSDDHVYESLSSKLALANLHPVRYQSIDQARAASSDWVICFIHEHSTNSLKEPIAPFHASAREVIVTTRGENMSSEGDVRALSPPFSLRQIEMLLSEQTPQQSKERDKTRTEREPSYGLKVLLVEDVQVNQKIAINMLDSLGVDATIASNGAEAVEACSATKFDAILMDCQMPVMDGYTATKCIRERELAEGIEPTSIIALTAGGDADERMRAFDVGMNAFVRKPFTASDLSSSFERLGLRKTTNSALAQVREPITEDQGAELQVLDSEVIASLIDLHKNSDGTLIPQLAQGFEQQLDEKLEEISGAICKSDWEAVRKAAHAVKSMSASIGALSLRTISESLERNFDTLSADEQRDKVNEIRIRRKVFSDAFMSSFEL